MTIVSPMKFKNIVAVINPMGPFKNCIRCHCSNSANCYLTKTYLIFGLCQRCSERRIEAAARSRCTGNDINGSRLCLNCFCLQVRHRLAIDHHGGVSVLRIIEEDDITNFSILHRHFHLDIAIVRINAWSGVLTVLVRTLLRTARSRRWRGRSGR